MAISFVGVDSNDSVGANVTSIVVPKPAGVQDGDLLIAWLYWRINNGSVITSPAGFAIEIAKAALNNAGSDLGSELSFKIASSEPANYTFLSNQTQRVVAAIIAYRGVKSATPIDASDSEIRDSFPGSTIQLPSIVTTVADAMILSIAAGRRNAASGLIGGGTGIQRLARATNGNTFGGTIRILEKGIQAVAGATGTDTMSNPTNNSWAGVTLALIPELPTGGGAVSFMGDASTLPRQGERMERAEGYRVFVPKGARLKNPVQRIEDPWGTIRRIKPEDEEEEEEREKE